MKRTIKLIGMFAVLAALVLSLVACGNVTPSEPPEAPQPTNVEIFKGGANPKGYIIVYPEGDSTAKSKAIDLSGLIQTIIGERPTIVSDAEPVAAYEILVGKTNRALSISLAAAVDARIDDYKWGIAVDNTSLALYAAQTLSWSRCFDDLMAFVKDDDLVISSGLTQINTLSQEAYDEKMTEIANTAAKEKIEDLQEKISAFRPFDFYGSTQRYSWAAVKDEVANSKDGKYGVKLDATEVIDMSSYMVGQPYDAPSEENSPTVGQHPRLLFTEEDIPALKAALNNPASAGAYSKLKGYLSSSFDGKLDPITYTDPVAAKASGKRSISNYNAGGLAIIQGKAYYYAITGEQLYGYQAVYAMLNYLDTLDIGYFDSDQCRYYGHTAYTAALVYDWCYDLMDSDTREMMALGIQNSCFLGYSSLPDGSVNNSGKKSETNFPPTGGTGPIEGHGSEMELLRDYLAVAIAIYDEHPDWYGLIGGRMFHHYIPMRNFYYSNAGAYPEGTATYAPWRYMADQYSAWMLESALGESPYVDDMRRVVPSMAAHILNSEGAIFSTGDGGGETWSSMRSNAILAGYLHNDPYMYALGAAVLANGGDTSCASVTAAELLICVSRMTEVADSFSDGIDTIYYNEGYYQQIIIRRNWRDDSPVVLMRGASSTTYGHSHQASGEFQIYYKGLLAGDDGVYDNYGSNHHLYYHKATIAHSCLLVFNPDLKNTNNGFYSGGQPKNSGTGNTNDYESFIEGSRYSTGKTISVKFGYEPNGSAKFAYYDNDLTQGYAVNKVDYVGRTMLTVMTGDKSYPMILFVYDRINVPETDYTKSFILQCAKEPYIDYEYYTTTVDNGQGKMILQPMIGCATINKYGGESGEDPQRYWISTQNKNCPSFGGLSSGGTGAGGGRTNNTTCWGKIEIQTAPGNMRDVMLNVIYVTDSANEELLTTKTLRGAGYDGAIVGDQIAIFAFGDEGTDLSEKEISFSVDGLEGKDYYVGGLAAGTWSVRVGGQDLGEMTVKDGENMISFSAMGAGTVIITPVELQAE